MFRVGFLLCILVIVCVSAADLAADPGSSGISSGTRDSEFSASGTVGPGNIGDPGSSGISSGTGDLEGSSGTVGPGNIAGPGSSGISLGTGGSGSSPLPELVFNCDKDGKINITNAEKYKSLYVLEGTNKSNEQCVGVYNPVKTGTSIIITIDKCAPDKFLTVAVMSFAKDDVTVIGGEHVALYKLACYSGNVSGITPNYLEVVKTMSPVGISNNRSQTQETKLGDDVIAMFISKTEGVLIGDRLILTISGPEALVYVAKECNASDPFNLGITLRLIKDGNVSETGDPALMTAFATKEHKEHTVSMSSTIHAFHFDHQEKVTFTCTVWACKDKVTCGNIEYMASTRRKRNVNVQTHILSSTITVHDHLKDDEDQLRSYGYSEYLSNWLMVLLAALLFVGHGHN